MQKFWFREVDGEKLFVMASIPLHASDSYRQSGWNDCIIGDYPSSGTGSTMYSRSPAPYPEDMFKPMPNCYALFPDHGRERL